MMDLCDEIFRIEWLDNQTLEAEFFLKLEDAGQRPLDDKQRSRVRTSFIDVELVARRGQYDPRRTAKNYSELLAVAEDLLARVAMNWPQENDWCFERMTDMPPRELNDALTRLIVGLTGEIDRINQSCRRGRKRHKHIDTLLFQMADVFADAGGSITLGGGPFTKFLWCVWDHLPRSCSPVRREAFIERAQMLLPELKKSAAPLFQD